MRQSTGSRCRRPLTVVDLDAFDATPPTWSPARGHADPGGQQVVRVPALLARALAPPGFAGRDGIHAGEALWLDRAGVTDALLVAYPTVDRARWPSWSPRPAARGRITLMVDDPAHLDVIDSVRASPAVPGPGRDRRRRRPAGRRPARRPAALADARHLRGLALARDDHRTARLPAGRRDVLRGTGRRRRGRRAAPRGPPSSPAEGALADPARDPPGRVAAGLRDLVELDSGTAAARLGRGPPRPTRSSPRSPPARGCWSRRCSTTTAASSRARRRLRPPGRPAPRRPASRPCSAAGWSPPDRRARPAAHARGRRPACTHRHRGRRRGADPADRPGGGDAPRSATGSGSGTPSPASRSSTPTPAPARW